MSNGLPASPGCPACDATDAVPFGVVVAESPPHGLAAQPPSDPEIRRIIERKYGCRSCGKIFSIIEEFCPPALSQQ